MRLIHSTSPAFAIPRPLPPGETLFAIGDVHGMADHLSRMRDVLRRRAREVVGHATIVTLGDYVNRGPASVPVLLALAAPHAQPGLTERFLTGNHDAMLRAVLDPAVPAAVRQWNRDGWMFNGGRSLLKELGLADSLPTAIDDVTAAVRAALPAAAVAFLDALEPAVTVGPVILTHAGIHPSIRPAGLADYLAVGTDDPGREGFLWVRDPFLHHDAEGDDTSVLARSFVVHGHTPAAPTLMRHRLGIDTGCYRTGVLTAVEMAGDRARLHHVHPEAVTPPALRDLSSPRQPGPES